MIVLEKNISGKGESVIKKAKAFFGPQGEGLTVDSEGDCCISFTGGGGYVTVTIKEEEKKSKTRITVETREWEYQAKEFMETL
jgi:hypothetical protein